MAIKKLISFKQFDSDYLYSLFSQSSRYLVQGLYFIILALIVDVTSFGKIIYLHSIGIILGIALDNGSQLRVLVDIPKSSSKGFYIYNDVSVKLFVGILVIPTLLLVSLLRKDIFGAAFLYMYATYMQVSFIHLSNILKSTNHYKIESYINAVSHYSLLFFLGYFLITSDNLNIYTLSLYLILNRVIILCIYLYVINNILNLVKVLSFRYIKYFIVKGFPLGLLTFLAVTYVNIDAILISEILNDKISGEYQFHFKIMMATMIIPEAVNPILLNRLTVIKNPSLIAGFKNKTLLLLILSGVIFSIVYVFGMPIITEKFGDIKVYSYSYLFIFSIVILLRYIGILYGNILLVHNLYWFRVKTLLSTISIGITINVIFLKSHGIVVAIISLLLTHIILNVTYILKARNL